MCVCACTCVCVSVCDICVYVSVYSYNISVHIDFYVIGIVFQSVSEPYCLFTSSNLIRITFKPNRDYPSDGQIQRRTDRHRDRHI